MCVRKKDITHLNAEDKDWYFESATEQSCIELTKYLMNKYNIPIENVIRHCDVTGKTCLAPYIHDNAKWKAFHNGLIINNSEQNERLTQAEFNQMMDIYLEERKNKEASAWAKNVWDKATNKNIFDGTMPQGLITRQEVATVLIDRLKLE